MQTDGKNILMLGPGFHEFGEATESSNHQFGMFRAAAWLKDTGHDVRFVDCGLPSQTDHHFMRLKERHHGWPVKQMKCGMWQGEGIEKTQLYYGKPFTWIRNQLAKQRPDEVWVGSGLTYHWETTADLVRLSQEMFPSVRVRVGGIYPSLVPEHASSNCPGADVWVGEIPEAKSYWPDYDVYPDKLPFRTVKLNTGCTVSKACSFCAVKTLEPRFKFRGPEDFTSYVEKEMHQGVRMIQIWASQLLQPPQAFMELMERLYVLQCKHNVKLQIYASEGVQPSLFTPEMARAMVRAGFRIINIPMESISKQELESFNKPSGLNDYFRAVQIAKEAGFEWIGAFILAGTPGQKLEDLVHAVVDCWYRRISPTMMKYTIIPGTQDWEEHPELHRGKGLHELHPSLWCGAREDLKVRDLEEVTAILRLGYDRWCRLPRSSETLFRSITRRADTHVDRLFERWCKIYGLKKNGRFLTLDMATPHEPPAGVPTVTKTELLWSFGNRDTSLAV